MRTICFVKENPQVRIYKQALALKKTGKYRLILIAQIYDKELFTDVFDEIINFGLEFNYIPKLGFHFFGKNVTVGKILNKMFKFDERRLAKIVKETDADLFHAHAEPNTIPKIVIENTSKPVVFDAYDFSGISSGIENLDEKERIAEKYCLEHADGIIRKGPPFEIDYYRQQGYEIKCPEIQWMEYCDEDLFADTNAKKLSGEDGELHLVFTGSISSDPKYRYKYFIPLGKQLAKQKIHFHIYPTPFECIISKEYIELDKKEKYFHFHKPVPFKELSMEIAKYDWGLFIHPIYGEKNIPRMTQDKVRVSMGNKLFSYLEAALPVIVSDHLEIVKETIEKYRIGFAIRDKELPSLKEMIKSCDYAGLRKNVLKVRNELSLKNQVYNLVEFYERVVSEKKEV